MSNKYKINKIIIISLILLIGLALIPISGMASEEIIVDETGSGDYITIEEAVYEAEDGDTITIREGEYDGTVMGTCEHCDNPQDNHFDEGKSLHIQAASGELVQVSGYDGTDSPAFDITYNNGNEISIEGITFENASKAIKAHNSTEVIIEDNSFLDSVDDSIILNNNISSIGSGEGINIIDEGNYWNSSRSDEVIAQNGNLEIINDNPNPSLNELKLNKNNDELDIRTSTKNTVSGTLIVDGENDNDLSNGYETLEQAIIDSSSESTILVYPKDNNERYDTTDISSENTSFNDELTIIGQELNGEIPVIEKFVISQGGSYNIANFNISETVNITNSSADVNLNGNYWGSSEGPSENQINDFDGNVSHIPFCIDSNCIETSTDIDNDICYTINNNPNNETQEVNCEEETDETIDININENGLTEDSNLPLRYNLSINIESNVSQQTSFDLIIPNSDSNSSRTVIVGPDTQDKNIDLHPSYVDSISSDMISTQLNIILSEDHTTSTPIQELNLSQYDNLVDYRDQNELRGSLIQSQPDVSDNIGNVVSKDFETVTELQFTNISRFNDGSSESQEFSDNSIPPSTTEGGDIFDGPVGEVDNFENALDDQGQNAIISPNDDLMNIGMSMDSITGAEKQVLELEYALQSENSGNVNLDIVDQQGEVISESRILQTTTDDTDITEENIETTKTTILLTNNEVQHIAEQGTLYAVFNSDNLDDGDNFIMDYMKIQSGDEELFDDDLSVAEEGIEHEIIDNSGVEPTSFTISFNIDSTFNSDEGTYDVEPNENLDVTLDIRNSGDTTINKEVGVEDIYHIPDENHFPNEDSEDILDNLPESLDPELQDETFEIELEPGEQDTIPISLDWDKGEFGEHTIQFVELDGDEQEPLETQGGSTLEFNTYVLQPTTLHITDLETPESNLIYSNFNSDINIENIGDLSGERDVKSNYENWSSIDNVEVGSGDPRNETTSDENKVLYDRELDSEGNQITEFYQREYSPPSESLSNAWFETGNVSFQYDQENDDIFRANSPFGTNIGEHVFTAEVENNFEGEFDPRVENIFKELLYNQETSETELEEIEITEMQFKTNDPDGSYDLRPTEDEGTLQASAYPYTSTSLDGGLGTMYDEEGNRASHDLEQSPFDRPNSDNINSPLLDSITSYEDYPFGNAHSILNRYCYENNNLDNLILPGSELTDCGSETGITDIQSPRFYEDQDTTGDTTFELDNGTEIELDGVDESSSEDLKVGHAKVYLSNNNSEQFGTARLQVTTDKSVSEPIGLVSENNDFDENVVGAADVLVPPESNIEAKIPVVLQNNEDIDGTHVLEVQPRDSEDYLTRGEVADPFDIPESPISGERHNNFEVPISVNTFGDVKLEELTDDDPDGTSVDHDDLTMDGLNPDGVPEDFAVDYAVNQVCEFDPDVDNDFTIDHLISDSGETDREQIADEEHGLNIVSGTDENGIIRSDADCNLDTDTDTDITQFIAQYNNYGGDEHTIDGNTLVEFDRRSASTEIHEIMSVLSSEDLISNNEYGEYISDHEQTLDPNEEFTYEIEKTFSEPGLYHIRQSPCRDITEDGPQDYNLEGFTGIYQDYTDNMNDIISDATSDDYSAEVISDLIYHGAEGCESTSVFVYDVTNPSPDFAVFDTEYEAKQEDDTEYETQDVDNITSSFDEDQGNIEVYEGGMIAFDGSSKYYGQTGDTQDIAGWSSNRTYIEDTDDISNDLSVSNTRITELYWEISDSEPNFGEENYCEQVNDDYQNNPDEHCYMEQFIDKSANYDVVTNRFTESGEQTLRLTAYDDPMLTEGDRNSDYIEHDIDVIADDNPPDVELTHEIFNDLSYDADSDGGDTAWVRNENVLSNNLDNFESEYNNLYEGERVCLNASASDNAIGISQDRWTNIDDGTKVIDDGNLTVEDGNTASNNIINDLNTNETREGDRSCIVRTDDGPQDFEYQAWDFAENKSTGTTEVVAQEDNSRPTIDSFSSSYSGSSIWAANSSTGYSGGTVEFSANASDSGVGIACMDLQSDPRDDDCQSMGDGSSGNFTVSDSAENLGYTSEGTESETLEVTDWHGNTRDTDVNVNVAWDDNDPSISNASDTEIHTYGNNESPPDEDSTVVCSEFNADGTDVYDASHSGDGEIETDETTDSSGDICVEFTWDVDVQAEAEADPDECEEDQETITDTDEDDETYSGSATIDIEDYHGNTDSAEFSFEHTYEDEDEDTVSCPS